ncbi:hypothetical protein [Dyella caseinilytica]|uniref:Uncharacterized protein n=1 Tax=Dyella caseinilytica TaxID=1849581 RepID=A0ABX7H2A5_9GAMM|nr:hypothetical protein [Dyella caseinilytica]QRN55535.1 hypothetical protein ISN74_09535 [Dyella caseinilytica]
MNTAYISALAGLTGAGIGGLTSFATSWLTQRTQLAVQYREAERKRRETLFNAFIAEASRLYGDALVHGEDDVTQLVKLYALVTRIRLTASPTVLMTAERAMDTIVDTYLKPNKTLHELKIFAEQGGMDFLHDFGEACRAELAEVMLYSFPS